MTSRLPVGVCQNVLCNVDMASDLDIVVEANASAIGFLDREIRRAGVDETIQLMNRRSIVASSYFLIDPVLELSSDDVEGRLKHSVTVAAALGAPTLVVASGPRGNLSTAEADEKLVERLGAVGPLARRLGVRIGIEPVHPFLHFVSYVHTIRHAAEIATRVENAGVTLDVVHTYWDRHVYEDITRYAESICTVQLGNLSGAALHERRWARVAFDGGVVPIGEMVYALHGAGYRGYYENEVSIPTSRVECIEAIRAGQRWFDALWDE